jgi:glycosyltransferase involved in cell wall biosynthesis
MFIILLVGFGPAFSLSHETPQMDWRAKRNLVYRELDILIANALASSSNLVYLLTYDDQASENLYSGRVAPNVVVLYRPRGVPLIVYGLLAPLVHRRQLRASSLCRTVELRGSLTALLCKMLYGTRVLVRQGYQVSGVIKSVHAAGGIRPFRSRIYSMLMSFYELLACRMADTVVVESIAHKTHLVGKFGVSALKIYVVPNWVNTNLFKPMPATLKEKGRVVFVGSLNLVKNVFSLIEAVKGIPRATLYFIGDGPLRRPLERKLHEGNIKNVVLLGTLRHETIPLELNKSEVFVLPSFFEGSPRALLEAMACGLSVVGSRIEGVREIIQDGFTGLLCDTNAESIRNAIRSLLSDASLRAKMGSNARRSIQRSYTVEKVLENENKVLYSMKK